MESFDTDLVTNGDFQVGGVPAVQDLAAQESKIIQALAAYHNILKAALKYTHAGDWVNLGGKPYLLATGAERIARPFGVYLTGVKFSKEERTDANGKYFMYFCLGTVGSRLLGAELTFEGTCSSRDKFFGTFTETRDGQKVTVLKPLEDVSEPDIKKKAWNNMFVNGITRLLGLRGLKWELLAESGIKQGETASVQYGGKGASETISEAQGKLLYVKLKAKEIDHAIFCKEMGLMDKDDKPTGVNALPKNKMNDALSWIESLKV